MIEGGGRLPHTEHLKRTLFPAERGPSGPSTAMLTGGTEVEIFRGWWQGLAVPDAISYKLLLVSKNSYIKNMIFSNGSIVNTIEKLVLV